MEDLTTQANEKIPQKTLLELKVEIKFHLGQMAGHAVEIGNLLIQAKEQVGHGNFGKWLEDNFNLKYRSAKNFMDIAERFGSNLQMSADFNQSQLIEMLALPEGEEDKFIAEKAAEGTPVEDMTVKQLREKVAKWKADFEKQKSETENLFAEKSALEKGKAELERQNSILQKSLKQADSDKRDAINKLTVEKNSLQEQLQNQKPIEKLPEDYEPLKAEKAELESKISQLEKQLQEKPIEVQVPADYEKNKKQLADLQAKYDEFSQLAVIVKTLESISQQIDGIMFSSDFGKALAYFEKNDSVAYNKFLARVSDFARVIKE